MWSCGAGRAPRRRVRDRAHRRSRTSLDRPFEGCLIPSDSATSCRRPVGPSESATRLDPIVPAVSRIPLNRGFAIRQNREERAEGGTAPVYLRIDRICKGCATAATSITRLARSPSLGPAMVRGPITGREFGSTAVSVPVHCVEHRGRRRCPGDQSMPKGGPACSSRRGEDACRGADR